MEKWENLFSSWSVAIDVVDRYCARWGRPDWRTAIAYELDAILDSLNTSLLTIPNDKVHKITIPTSWVSWTASDDENFFVSYLMLRWMYMVDQIASQPQKKEGHHGWRELTEWSQINHHSVWILNVHDSDALTTKPSKFSLNWLARGLQTMIILGPVLVSWFTIPQDQTGPVDQVTPHSPL